MLSQNGCSTNSELPFGPENGHDGASASAAGTTV